MNKNALRRIGASALVVAALTACGGPGASTEAVPAPASETATPAPFRTYSKAELTKVVGDVRDIKDIRLLVMPEDRLADIMKQVREIVGNSAVEPVECADFATGGGVQLEDGAVVGIGASASSTAESAQLLMLVSGVSEEKLKALAKTKAKDVAACGVMQMSILGQTVEANTKALPTSAKTPGAVAYLTTIPGVSGSPAQLVVTAVRGGVVLVSQSSGAKVDETDLPKIEAMLDSAAEQIK